MYTIDLKIYALPDRESRVCPWKMGKWFLDGFKKAYFKYLHLLLESRFIT